MTRNDVVPSDARLLVDRIRQAAGAGPPYDLSSAAMMILPLDVVDITPLTPRRINQWLSTRGVGYAMGVAERTLHGCLLAYRSTGMVFVDAGDSDAERRYTVAHEVAHFLIDYWIPRQRALRDLGPTIQDVLDGHRAPRIEERLDGIFLHVDLHPYVCLLDRGAGTSDRTEIWTSENRADQLAVELLAPFEEVCGELRAGVAGHVYFRCRAEALRLLVERFGLPDGIARAYAREIAYEITGGLSVQEGWGL